jgi:hypothetical protein
MTPEQIALVCHEANRAYCEAHHDFTSLTWSEAGASAIAGVEFALANPEATPAAQHEKWMADKAAEGWIYGERKNVYLKTHPCMVPYEELPEIQRKKDALFQAIVRALA